MRFVERWQPIARKLPLLISVLLIAVVAAFSWTGYRQLERALTASAGERAVGVSRRIASLLSDAARRIGDDSRALAADSLVVRALEHGDSASIGTLQTALQGRIDRVALLTAMEVLNARREPVLSVGVASPRPTTAAESRASKLQPVPERFGLGPLGARGDTVLFHVLTPVLRADGDTLGFLFERRRLSADANAGAVFEQLIGTDASIMMADSTTGFWTDLEAPVERPALELRANQPITYVAANGSEMLGAAANVTGTSWDVWVERPTSSIMGPAREVLVRTNLVGLLLVVLGTLAAWLITRHITVPLGEVTHAAEDLAAGDYSRRVTYDRSDELGRLSASFNSMAQQVEDSTHQLETRVADRTGELRQALEDLKSAQQELVRNERLAILGQLAGGVGHELRNPLGVMTNVLYYLGTVLHDASPDVHEYLGMLRTQIALSEKIVGDLLDYARVRQPRREPFDMREVVDEQLARLGSQPTVRVERDISRNLPFAFADRTQIGQVVLNLLTNGVQAIDGAGSDTEASGTLTLRARHTGDMVQLDVIDTGPGIEAGKEEMIFEPLFTTKARGIGLGLAVSRSLVRANGGEIAVENRPGDGCTFSLTLPATPRHEVTA
ncbi:MAG TPA: ATP-binding protein [Gemmatimonadaceae bacterium]|nr:ATP-binding protein [Gemmatimonadaceae bacterium]